MAPKWFDKNLALSNEDNFDQLRDVLRLAREAYLADAAPATRLRPLRAPPRRAPGRAAPRAASTRCWRATARRCSTARCSMRCAARAACRSTRRCAATWPASARGTPEFDGLDIDALPRRADARRHASRRATPSAWSTRSPRPTCTSASATACPRRWKRWSHAYGHRYFKLKVGGKVAADLARLTAIAVGARPHRRRPTSSRSTATSSTPSAAGVAELVARMPRDAGAARACGAPSLFIEQPIARKLALDDRPARAPTRQAGDHRRVRRRARRLRAGARARLRRRLVQDLQGPLQVAAQRGALRGLERAKQARRATSCRPKT